MKGHFTKDHNTHIDAKQQQKNNSNTNSKMNTETPQKSRKKLNSKTQRHKYQKQIGLTKTLDQSEPLNLHHVTVERGQWQQGKQRKKNKRFFRKHPRNAQNNHQFESVCPESGIPSSLETRNRYSQLRIEEGKEEEDKEEEKIITRQIQSSIMDTPKRKTDLIDSLMIEMISSFPKSIKNYFDKIEREIPQELILPNPNSELNFVQSRIGENKDTINIKFMLDQGSSHSVISWDLWERVPFRHRYELASGTTNFVTTSDETQRDVKRVIVPFYLKDNTGREHKRVYCFYVVDGRLPHQAYLGIDWLQQSPFCMGIFNNYFNLTNIKKKSIGLYQIPIKGMSNLEYKVSINVNLLSDITARPNTTVKALVVAEGVVPNSNDLIIEGLENLENPNRYTIIPILTNKTENDIYEIYIKNNSNKELYIEKDTLMGEILDDEHKGIQEQVIFHQTGKSSYINPITMSNCFLKNPNNSANHTHQDMASTNNVGEPEVELEAGPEAELPAEPEAEVPPEPEAETEPEAEGVLIPTGQNSNPLLPLQRQGVPMSTGRNGNPPLSPRQHQKTILTYHNHRTISHTREITRYIVITLTLNEARKLSESVSSDI